MPPVCGYPVCSDWQTTEFATERKTCGAGTL